MGELIQDAKEVYTTGTFCWFELATSDAPAAKSFYNGLFGWESEDVPMGPDGDYTMLSLPAGGVGAMFQITPEMAEQGVPPHWGNYIWTDDLDATTAKAKTLGATIIKEPFEVPNAGRMSIIQDPTGAIISFWKGNDEGKTLTGVPGAAAWNELATKDTEKATAFYCELLGWSTRVDESAGMKYTTFMDGEERRGGMMEMTAEWGDAPPHWMIYFASDDVAVSVEKARSLGAQILVETMTIPEICIFAVISDPQGAVFSVVKFFE